MSFGGGSADYRINYIITTSTQGAGAGPINQVSAATDKMTASNQKAVASADQLKTAHERVTQAGLGVSKAAKGMAFGFIGMTTAGAEMVGMMSMYQQTQVGVAESQAAVSKALQESGKDSTEYTKAVQDLAKANRWAAMTFRNLLLSIFDMIPFLVLSVNGILKLRTALAAAREAKAMEAALLGVGNASKTVATTTTTYSAAQAAANVQTVASTGAFKNQTVSLGTATAATNTHTAATSKLKTVMMGLGKGFAAFGVALAAGAAAALAYKNNIGGLRDAFDKIGVGIGNAIPQLKGFLNMLKDLALAFPNLGKMWDIITGKKKAGFEAMGLTDEEIKRLDEAREAVNEFRDSATELFREIAMADKGDRKDLFKSLGITTGKTQFDDAKKGAKDFFKELENGITNLDNIESQFKSLDLFSKLDEFINVDPDTIKKIRFSMEDKLRDVFEGGDDIFDKLADVVEQNATKSQPEFNAAIAEFAADNEGIVDILEAMDKPDLAKYFDGIIATAREQMRKSLQDNLLTDESDEAEKWKDEWWDSMMGDDTVSEAEKAGTELVKGIITGFNNVDWSGIKTTLRMQIMDPLVVALETIGANVIPIVRTAITNNINKGITTEGAGGEVTGIDWEGLWNKILETGKAAGGDAGGDLGVGKATWWKENVEPRITAFWDQLTNIENWNRYASEKQAQFAEIPKLAWAHVENAFATYILQPLDWLNDQAIKFVEQLTSVENWNRYFEEKKQAFAEIPKLLWAHVENAFANTAFGKGVNTVIELAKKYIFNTAEGATPTVTVPIDVIPVPQIQTDPSLRGMVIGEGSRFGPAGTVLPSDLETWAKKVQLPAVSADLPINPDKIIVNPPTGQNATPTITGPNGIMPSFTTPTATIQPVSATVDIGGSTVTVSDSAGPSREGSGFPGSWAGAYAIYIDYPGTVGIKPQSVAFDITEADLAVGVATFQAIAVEADKTKQFIVNAYNELAATLAELFATTSQKWSEKSAEIGNNAIAAREAVTNEFNELVATLFELFDTTSSDWSETMAEVGQNAADVSQAIINEFESAMEGIIDAADDMLGEWSNTMDDMVQAAEDAADDIESALAGIPDEEVVIRYRTEGKPQAHGTSGMWVHKPTTFVAGEQGPEFVQVTRQHSKPGLHNDGGDGGGSVYSTFNGTVNLKISGNEIINPTKLSQKIKMTVGENRDRFG